MKILGKTLQTEPIKWKIGPYHPSLPGPMIFNFELDGEVIVNSFYETGFLHRGIEKTMSCHPWPVNIVFADRIDPEGAIYAELALCLAVEQLAKIHVPKRATQVRIVISELTRLSQHLRYIIDLARSVGADTVAHYVLRDREKVLDLFELLTGSRFTIGFLRYGGIGFDISEGFIERAIETCHKLSLRLKEYNDLFSYNQILIKRVANLGVISRDLVMATGMSGPNARAAGIDCDLRKAAPYSGYELIEFRVPLGRGDHGVKGDAHDRYLVRVQEISQSIEIIKHLAEEILPGDILGVEIPVSRVPEGEVFIQVEAARGILSCHVISDGSDRPMRIHYSTPSIANLAVAPVILKGLKIESLPVILASLDINLSEVDR